jgi:hypothetical protein
MYEETIYQIEEEIQEGRAIIIKAGKKEVKDKIILYEGIKLKVPKEVRDRKEIIFAILSIAKGKEHDTFELWLHAHNGPLADEMDEPYEVKTNSDCYVDAGGDIETKLIISKDLLKKWTKLDGREIDRAFEKIRMGNTYNLMLTLPRKITIQKDKVIITKSVSKLIDSINVCRLIFNNKYPLDI